MQMSKKIRISLNCRLSNIELEFQYTCSFNTFLFSLVLHNTKLELTQDFITGDTKNASLSAFTTWPNISSTLSMCLDSKVVYKFAVRNWSTLWLSEKVGRQTPKNERERITAVQELKATNKMKLVLHWWMVRRKSSIGHL